MAATSNTYEARGFRCNWVRDNADLVAFLHALRVELQVRLVMQHVVPCTEAEPFLYWLRFEWGTNGNPHAHGQRSVSGNPSLESAVEDQATADFLRTRGSGDAPSFRTKQKAEAELGEFFGQYLTVAPCSRRTRPDDLCAPLRMHEGGLGDLSAWTG